MKAAVSIATVACLFAATSQSVLAQTYWQVNPNCAPVLSYSSAAPGSTATYYAGSAVRTSYAACAPVATCAVAPTCAPPAPRRAAHCLSRDRSLGHPLRAEDDSDDRTGSRDRSMHDLQSVVVAPKTKQVRVRKISDAGFVSLQLA
jgi:hypothetical protein